MSCADVAFLLSLSLILLPKTPGGPTAQPISGVAEFCFQCLQRSDSAQPMRPVKI